MEATPGRFGTVIAHHRNSEGELTTVERRPEGAPFGGQYLLCFYDETTTTVAPTLLDDETVVWLRDCLNLIGEARP